MHFKKCVAALACAMIAVPATGIAEPNKLKDDQVKHVLLISVDGLHALDLTNWIMANPDSSIGQLSKHGIRYTNASTALPSDSFPASPPLSPEARPRPPASGTTSPTTAPSRLPRRPPPTASPAAPTPARTEWSALRSASTKRSTETICS